MESQNQDAQEMWAIVQVFGHTAYAGKVSAHAIGGCSFVRIDVPEVEGQPGFTKILGNGAIFDITPCTEEAARAAARQMRARPVSLFMLPEPGPTRAHFGEINRGWDEAADDEGEEL